MYVCIFKLFIYACLLPLAHELVVERVKALGRRPSYVTFSRGCCDLEFDCALIRVPADAKCSFIPVAE